MAELKFVLDIERMTFDDMIDLQEGQLRRAKEIIAKFVVDENGKPLDKDKALAKVGGLPISKVKDVFTEFGKQVKDEMGEVLPNG